MKKSRGVQYYVTQKIFSPESDFRHCQIAFDTCNFDTSSQISRRKREISLTKRNLLSDFEKYVARLSLP